MSKPGNYETTGEAFPNPWPFLAAELKRRDIALYAALDGELVVPVSMCRDGVGLDVTFEEDSE